MDSMQKYVATWTLSSREWDALGLSNAPSLTSRVVALAGSGLHAGVYVQLAEDPLQRIN